MTIVRSGILPGGTFKVPKPVITSTVLPNGTTTVPYSFQFTATAQQGPLSWVILSNSDPTGNGLTLSSTGLLSGTPVNPETMNFTVQVLDFLGQAATAPISLTFTAFAPGVGLGPSAMWDGGINSTFVLFSWWPPTDGTTPDSYNVYRNGVQIATGVVPKFFNGGTSANPSIPLPYYRDLGPLTPSTTYNYTVTCVTGGVESQPGPTHTVTTLAGNATPTTPPTPPTDPATFFPAYSLPVGGTRWTPANGAALTTALAGAQPGDVIVLTSGVTYTSTSQANNAAFTMAGGSNAGWIYIVSDQDPGVNATGKLTPYSYVTSLRHTEYFATTAPLAGATSLTLTSPFTGRSGWYKTVFNSSNPSGIESFQALYQNGSTSVVWNVGLQANCPANFLVGVGNNVSPWDAGIPIGAGNVTNATPTMPTIQFTQNGSGGNGGTGLFVSGQNLRFVGINFQPLASFHTGGLVGACVQVNNTANNIIFDRCVMGRDNTVPTYTYFTRSLLTGGNNVVVHQSYLYGADTGPSGSDSQAINISANGPYCFQNNYLEAVSEVMLSGGNKAGQTAVMHDITIRHNWTHKPTAWQVLRDTSNFAPSRRMKNHLELKCGIRFHWHGNVIQNNAALQASQGQGGRAFVLTPRDQISAPSGLGAGPSEIRGVTSITWASGVATVTLGSVPIPVGTNFTTSILNCPVAGFNGTFVATVQSATTFTYSLPVNPGANSGAFNGYTLPPQAGAPWMNITDGEINDNQIYGCASTAIIAGGIDYNPTLHMARLWIHNNTSWINPAMTDDITTRSSMRGIEMEAWVPDVKLNNNTIIMVPQGSGYSVTGAGQPGISMLSIQQPNLGINQLNDRWTITDNTFDGETGGTILATSAGTLPNNGALGGVFVSAAFDPATLVWNKNLFYRDTASGGNAWPTGTFQALGNYASVGMADFISNTTGPMSPSDWNIVSGTYATASTTSGPLGATFTSSLALDQFPRTAWLAIAPVSNLYAGSTFQTNAAKYNMVVTGPFMGLEQSQGATFSTIFSNIKTQAAANGITNRCLHYTMSSEQSTVGGGGNASTYTVWSSKVNTTNWWIRTSYPAGSIVIFDANSGVLAQTSQNSILDGSGNTFYQGFWNHYDGVLRQGNAVSQGYASNLAVAANSSLDGYQMDNMFVQPRSTGAWQMNTTSFTSHWPNSADAQISTWIQQGQALQVAALKAINSDMIVLANSDYFVHSTGTAFSYAVALDPSQSGRMDAVLCESCVGGSSGIEGQTGNTTAGLMANLAAAEAQVSPSGTMVFIQSGPSHGTAFSSTNQAVWTAAEWQAVRFGLGCCFMRNYHYKLNNNGDYRPDRPYFTDETLQQGGNFGWLKHPVDPPQSAARTQGVWWRQFQGGVVFMNPAGNGVQTITLANIGLTGLSAIGSNGFGVASINSGNPVTSITLQDRDGRFLKF